MMKQEFALSHKIVPCPVEFCVREGYFRLDADTSMEATSGDEAVISVGCYLIERIKTATGFTLSDKGKNSSISLVLLGDVDSHLGTEGYTLDITPGRISISANAANGLFYGCQTLLQLMPSEIESRHLVPHVDWCIPCAQVRDYPRFPWRGLLLDVSRHFFTKAELLDYIDRMARYKFNVFHIHLTDDQGWRLEIKRYPKLTEVGAWRVPRTGSWWSFAPPGPGEKPTYGGFYTQEEIRDIVRYAATRFVTVLPEIDVPGHSLAALASYPELSCTGGPFDVNPGSKFQDENAIDNVLCAGNDKVFEFLDGVITEVAELFPCAYIHMGGDETTKMFWKACPRCQGRMKELNIRTEEEFQSYFVKRLAKIIESKGKRLIGWDEIIEGGLASHATVMSWRGISRGIEAARMGHAVIMTPFPHCYLDLYQGDPVAEPETYSMCRLKSCYEFEPLPDGVAPEYILGGQGNLWTESVPDMRQAQYMTWPRGMAIAEALWSPAEARDWESFVLRVEQQFARLDVAQVKYARSMYDVSFNARRDDQGRLIVTIHTELDGLDIHYTWAGTNPDRFHPEYRGPLTVPSGARELRAITYRNGCPVGREIVISLAELQKRVPEK